MKEVFKCRDWRMMRWDEEWKKAQAWGCPCITPRNIREVQAWKVGDAPEAPPPSSAKIRSPFKTLYFYCFMHYAFFLERQLLLFSVYFCFVFWNKWLDHIMFLLEEMNSLFICQEHSVFHSYRFNECSLFLLPRLAFIFHLDFCSDLVLSLHQGVFGPLVYFGFPQKSFLKKN
jgi:hypothetical protein